MSTPPLDWARLAPDRASPLPRYLQLAEQVAELVADGTLPPGCQLPPERELAAATGISRMTVRQALAHLARDGTVRVRHGVGAFVAEPKLTFTANRLLAFTDEAGRAAAVATRTIEQSVVAPPAPAAALLGLAAGEPVVRVVRLRLAGGESDRAPLRMVKAEVLAESSRFDEALRECDLALAGSSGGELDWFLTRSQIQCRLGRFNEAAAGLRRGFELTGSAVLEVECIDAMIDAGQFAEARGKVEAALNESRYRSSWLLRRARIHLGQGEMTEGHRDLADAIAEMNRRMSPTHPESGLLSERGFAYALLGDIGLAKRDLLAARKSGADAAMLRRLELALNAAR